MNIAFIGLGNMGGRMAHNLLKAGLNVYGYDLNEVAIQHFAEAGGVVCDSPQAAAKQADVVISMLPAAKHVKEVYLGENGVLEVLKAGSLCIDSSTIDPQTIKDIAAVAQSKNIVHCGDVGAGQIAKICNNLILGISMAAVAEGMALGVKLGIDPQALAGVINTSSGRCWSSDVCNPWPHINENAPASRGYQDGFATQLMLKDLGLAVEAAGQVKQPVVLGGMVQQLYQQMCMRGNANLDFSSIIQQYLPQEA